MKSKNPWKFLRCIGITPWHIFAGEQRFVFFDTGGGPDGGVSEAVGETTGEEEEEDNEGVPADTEAATRAAAQQSVETGQGGLIRNAALTHESSQQYLRRAFESLPLSLQDDEEAQKAYLDADRDLDLARTVEDRISIIEDLQARIDRYDLSRYTPAEHGDENAPPPSSEAEEGEGDGAEVLPPGATETDRAPAVPEVRRLTDAQRIARTLKINAVNKKQIAAALDIKDVDKATDKELIAAVRKFQQELWAAATPEDKRKFEARYKNAKGFGDGIWGQDTQALFEAVAKYTDGKDKGFKEKLAKLNPPAAPAVAPTPAPAEVAAQAAPATPPAVEVARESKPPQVDKLPPFPKPAPSLPVFDNNRFYEVEDLPPADCTRLGVNNGDVLYLRKMNGNAYVFEKKDGTAVQIHKEYASQLDTDTDDDRDKKDPYIVARLESFATSAEYAKNIKIEPANIRLLDNKAVCILDTPAAGGAVNVVDETGSIIPNVLRTDLDDDADKEQKDQYIIARFRNAEATYKRLLAVTDAKDEAEIELLYNETDVSSLTDELRAKLTAGKETYNKANAYATLPSAIRLVSIADKTGKPIQTDVELKKDTIVAVLNETSLGRYYKIATEQGVVAYIEKPSQALALRSTKAAAPTRVV